MLQKPELSADLIGLLARMQTLPYPSLSSVAKDDRNQFQFCIIVINNKTRALFFGIQLMNKLKYRDRIPFIHIAGISANCMIPVASIIERTTLNFRKMGRKTQNVWNY